MRFLEPALGLAAIVLRGLAVPPGQWAGDWILVAGCFYLGQLLAREHPRAQAALGWTTVLWLSAIYAVHQGPCTLVSLGLR